MPWPWRGSLERRFGADEWGLVLGGSSGFGLATAQKLAAHGMSLALVHRDRRGAMHRIEPEFEKIRGAGVALRTWNADALDAEKRAEIVADLAQALGPNGRVKLLLHSIAFGNLKLLVGERPRSSTAAADLARELGVAPEKLAAAADKLLA
jgi:NAD(P)-dependent dehydrogenase (short-subunit alcohol dehydrogenase family)